MKKTNHKLTSIPLRIECPYCHWGYPWSDAYINQGWMGHKCAHCGKKFFNKIVLTGFKIQTKKELPEGVPCHTLPEAKEEDSDE